MKTVRLHPDFSDLLVALANRSVEYLIVGGYAVAFHARPRYTKDIDLFVVPTPANLARLEGALTDFGAPLETIRALRESDPADIVWMGAPPVRVDILRRLPGVDFEIAYGCRVESAWDGVPISVIGLQDLIKAKKAAGRPQDLLDVDVLERVGNRPDKSGHL